MESQKHDLVRFYLIRAAIYVGSKKSQVHFLKWKSLFLIADLNSMSQNKIIMFLFSFFAKSCSTGKKPYSKLLLCNSLRIHEINIVQSKSKLTFLAFVNIISAQK